MAGGYIGAEPMNTGWMERIRREDNLLAQQMIPMFGYNGEKLMAEVARLQLLRKTKPPTPKPDRPPVTRELYGLTWAPKDAATLDRSLRVSPMSMGCYAHRKWGGMCDENGFRRNDYYNTSGRVLTGRSGAARGALSSDELPGRGSSRAASEVGSRPRSEAGSIARSELGSRAASEADLRIGTGASSGCGSRALSRRSRGKALSTASSAFVKQEVEQAVHKEIDKLLEELK